MKSNIAAFDQFVKIVREYDIQSVQFRELRVNDLQNNVEEVKREMISNLSQDELKKQLKAMLEQIEELKKEGREFIVPEWLFGDKIVVQKQVTNKKSCSVPYFGYWLGHDGILQSCTYDSSSVIGNFFEDDVKHILQNRDAFRRKALRGKCASSQCNVNIESSRVV